MAAASLARGRSGERCASSVAYPPPCAKIAIEPSAANQAQRKTLSPNETSRDLWRQSSSNESGKHSLLGELCIRTNHLVRCVTKIGADSCSPTCAASDTRQARGRGMLLYSGIDAKLDEDHLKILNAPGSDEVSGVTSTLCHVLTSRPG